jgi:hypothetical protein
MEVERVKLLATSLIKNTFENEMPKFKSPLAIINFACQIVEELTQRTKYKLTAEDKKKIGTFVVKELSRILKERNIISENLNEKVQNLSLEDLQDTIDDTISIWNDSMEVYETIKRLCIPRKIKKRKLEHIDATIALEDDPLLG